MSTIRIAAYPMHELEERAVEDALSSIDWETDGYVVGEIDPARLPRLVAEGVALERLPAVPVAPRTPGRDAVTRGLATASPTEGLESAALGKGMHVLQLAGPLLPPWQETLDQLGVTIDERIPDNGFIVDIPQAFVAQHLEQQPWVVALSIVTGTDRAVLELPLPVARPHLGGAVVGPADLWDVRVELGRVDAVKAEAEAAGVVVRAVGRRKLRVQATRDRVARLQAVDGVRGIERHIPPTVRNDRAAAIVQARGLQVNGVALDGDGEIVGVCDTGLDESHPDFPAAQVVDVVALGRAGDASDPHGHGTHVAGTIVGTGSASSGGVTGVAPAARLHFQSVLDSAGGLGGLPLELEDLFQAAHDAGVRVHNNSWGAAVASAYTSNSEELDRFVWENPDMLLVVAAGNEGTAANNRHAAEGFVDWLSVGAPATSKNALVVGASRSDRTRGGFSADSHATLWPHDYPDDPIARETVSGDAAEIAAFSSRGPCDDRRIKPDLVAPGTDILSCRAAAAPTDNFWGEYTKFSKKYAFMGGTSMATPVVTGAAILLRQWLRLARGLSNPSAALLKAILINGARRLEGRHAIADHAHIPNPHQGFGCLNLAGSLPDDTRELWFHDSWSAGTGGLASVGANRLCLFDVHEPGELRICMAYTDAPARSLQNDLTLLLEHPGPAPTTKTYGNHRRQGALLPSDVTNNVEVIRIPNAAVGGYALRVQARNILHGPQHFALAITGPLSNPRIL